LDKSTEQDIGRHESLKFCHRKSILKLILRRSPPVDFPPQNRKKAWHMTSKAHPLRNQLPHLAISVDALFSAAFHKSRRNFQRESLLGWRPVIMDADLPAPLSTPLSSQREPSPYGNTASTLFSNSPDVIVREKSDVVTIEVELPDIDEESLYLEVSGDLLIIQAKKLAPDADPSEPAKSHQEVMVNRYVKLPFAAKPGEIRARLDGPMLRITIGGPLASDRKNDAIER
jgi:HSP20 family molecular chaperone IbpA